MLGGMTAAHAVNIYPANIASGAAFDWSHGPGGIYGDGNDVNLQWGEADILNDGSVAITTTETRNGNGSLEFTAGATPGSKAGVAYYPGPNSNITPGPGFGLLAGLMAVSYQRARPVRR